MKELTFNLLYSHTNKRQTKLICTKKTNFSNVGYIETIKIIQEQLDEYLNERYNKPYKNKEAIKESILIKESFQLFKKRNTKPIIIKLAKNDLEILIGCLRDMNEPRIINKIIKQLGDNK